jgi:hypothetical protein
MYKVPGRMIVCDSIGSWIQEILWCYVIMKLFKKDIDAITCHCGSTAAPTSSSAELKADANYN